MTALYIAGGVVLLVALILLIPLRVRLEYSDEGFFLKVRLLFFTLVTMPSAEKEEKKLKLEKAGKKPAKKGGLARSLLDLKNQLPRALKKLFRGLKVREMKVYYLAACGDAYETAVRFGQASAAMGALTCFLENVFRIRDRDYRVDFSFEKTEPEIYIEARLSLAIGRIVSILWGLFVGPALKGGGKTEKPSENVKGGRENG